MRRYTSKHTYKWTRDIAYIVGLFASDGCLSNDGRHLNMTSKDLDIIYATLKILNKNSPVKTKLSPSGAQAYYVQFGDVSFYDFLISAGLMPRKSKVMGSLAIPKMYFADFLRGLFDGDGTVYGYQDKRWPSSFMYYTGFVSASPTFLIWLQSEIIKYTGVNGGKIKQGIRAQVLVFAKADSRKLYEFMYTNNPSFRLIRKFEKLKNFIINDPHVKITPVARVL